MGKTPIFTSAITSRRIGVEMRFWRQTDRLEFYFERNFSEKFYDRPLSLYGGRFGAALDQRHCFGCICSCRERTPQSRELTGGSPRVVYKEFPLSQG